MRKERVRIAIYIIVALLDLFLLSGALILQYYADKKMGVFHPNSDSDHYIFTVTIISLSFTPKKLTVLHYELVSSPNE